MNSNTQLRQNVDKTLDNLSEMELLRLYEIKDDGLKNRIYTVFYNRYFYFLKSEANRLFNTIDSNYFSMDFEDCMSESSISLKLALDWFKIDKFRGNPDMFSISAYVKLQVDAKISSYYWKRNVKKKKNVEQSYNPDLSYVKDRRDSTKEVEKSLLESSLDSRLDEQQKKLKTYLMKGFKEYKIKNILGINSKEYFSLKEKLKQSMISVGYTL